MADESKQTDISSSTSTEDAGSRPWEYIVKRAFFRFLNNFFLVYGIRSSISLLLRIIALVQKNPKGLLSLQEILHERHLIYRVDAVRNGLAIGGFTGIFDLLSSAFYKARPFGKSYLASFSQTEQERVYTAVAGGLASVSLFCQEQSSRKNIILYLFVRALQCWYNSFKARGWFHFWGSSWKYGDSLLFALSSAQVMYAYVMRPETLPPSYYKFIVHSGPIAEEILQGVRTSLRSQPMNLPVINEYMKKCGSSYVLTESIPAIVPCEMLHPHTYLCRNQFLRTFQSTFTKTLPLYSTLTFVPLIALQLKAVLRNPVSSLGGALFNSVRSTTFLATFCSVFMALACSWRRVVSVDHRFFYWMAGLLCSASILIEKKSKRSELALYVLPRALDSLYLLLLDRKWVPSLPQGDSFLFALSMSALMYFYKHESSTVAPLLKWLFDLFLKEEPRNPFSSKSLL